MYRKCPVKKIVHFRREYPAKNMGYFLLTCPWHNSGNFVYYVKLGCHMAQMDAKQAEKISKALSDPTRLKILGEIRKKHDWLYCVDLYEYINLAQPSICHHLKQLTETAIILPEKEGRNIKYTMNNDVIDDFIGFLQGLKK